MVNPKTSLFAGVLAGIGASVCCVGPLVLLTLGISGAWIGNLTALEPYRPALIALTLVFLGLAFRRLYFGRPVCADSNTLKRQRRLFWVVATMVLGLLLVPVVVPILYS